jgi:hypothetical protein
MRLGHEETEVRHVPARRMRISRDGEPSHELTVVLGHEHSGLGRAADGTQVAAFLSGAPPAALGDQPRFRLGGHVLGKPDEGGRVPRLRMPDDDPAH